MRITIKELRQLVKSVISESTKYDGSESMYEDIDEESFALDFELNGNDFEVEGKYYGDGEIEFDRLIIYTGDEENGIIDGMDISDEDMIEYSGYNHDDFDGYVIDLINR